MEYTKEMRDFMVEYTPGHHYDEIRAEFIKRFNVIPPPSFPKSYIRNHKLNTGFKGRYRKGNIPMNKGKKMAPEVYEKAKATMFNPGSKPPNTLPIGTEQMLADGYIWVKVADTPKVPKKENWVQKHLLLWREHHGEIPEGHVVIFLDGDRTNVTIENLEVVPRAVLSRLNQSHLRFNDADLTRTGIAIATLKTKAGEVRRKSKEASD